ncbi:MAG TPA: hypothetical protein VNZ94_00460 [Xanthobacteraceae bacterium]|nr:hypothetical protein [Xanthobacteraceae bacterium]
MAKIISTAIVRTPGTDDGEPVEEQYEATATVPPAPQGQPAAFVVQSAIMNVINAQLSGLAQAGVVPTEVNIRIE